MKKLIFLDTETTGRGDKDRMIQLAMKWRGTDTLTNSMNVLFKPPIPITFEAMAVHHITNEMVANLEPLNDTFRNHIQQSIDDRIVVAHNAMFDIEMLSRDGIVCGPFIDTLKIAQYLFDEPSYKLQYLRYRFDLKIDGKAHDAEGDVEVLEALFTYFCVIREMAINAHGNPDYNFDSCIDWMIEISKQPGFIRRMPFGKHKGIELKNVPLDYFEWLLGQKDIDPDLRFNCEQFLKPKTVATPPTVN